MTFSGKPQRCIGFCSLVIQYVQIYLQYFEAIWLINEVLDKLKHQPNSMTAF